MIGVEIFVNVRSEVLVDNHTFYPGVKHVGDIGPSSGCYEEKENEY